MRASRCSPPEASAKQKAAAELEKQAAEEALERREAMEHAEGNFCASYCDDLRGILGYLMELEMQSFVESQGVCWGPDAVAVQ